MRPHTLSFALAASLLLLLFALPASASKAGIVDPIAQTVNGGAVVDLGTVGPGQTVELQVIRGSGEIGVQSEKLWDHLNIDTASLPAGWRGDDSRTFENPLKAFVVLPVDAPNGEYTFNVTLIDDNEGVLPLHFSAHVTVSRDVLALQASPSSSRVGAGQPAVYTLRLSNTGRANDVFEISAVGLPSRWEFTKRVFLSHDSETDVNYEVVATESGVYPVRITVHSLSSSLITQTFDSRLTAASGLVEDAQATANGVLLFPSSIQVVYSLVGFLAHLFF